LTRCLFASDLHGRPTLYHHLFRTIERELPAGVFLGGDLLPSGLLPAPALDPERGDFIYDFLAAELQGLRDRLGPDYPRVYLILGNDDPRRAEAAILDVAGSGLWSYAHDRRWELADFDVYGYAFVPPTPFGLKDWERYDVSRYIPPGCSSPEEGWRSVPEPPHVTRYATIQKDLAKLAGDRALHRAVFLFHTPPHDTRLDRAALDGRSVDHVPLDVHIGSIAVRRFIEQRQPLLTLHGHVHESARLTGDWRDRIGSTVMLSAAHDGPELALVRFDPRQPEQAERELVAD
jgi:Icc-related predicted phosphoesterase